MLFLQNEEATRIRQIDLPIVQLRNSARIIVINSFSTFTIPKGLTKNIPNGNVRLLIYEYLNYVFILHI